MKNIIEFNNVNFKYDEDSELLNNLSMEVKQG